MACSLWAMGLWSGRGKRGGGDENGLKRNLAIWKMQGPLPLYNGVPVDQWMGEGWRIYVNPRISPIWRCILNSLLPSILER
jgi:hypothetical protein